MSVTEMSSLFLFRDYIGKTLDTSILKDSMRKEKINIYEKKLEEFLNTWMIFSCRNKCCSKIYDRNDVFLLKSNENVIVQAFYQIFGNKCVDDIMKFIIIRLNRFRHIIREEPNKSFDSSYVDYIDEKTKDIYNKVLTNKDSIDKLSTYKNIFKFYKQIESLTNEELMKKLDSYITEITNSYIENDLLDSKLLGFIVENLFYNNSLYSNLREICLVIIHEIICRFYESININPYKSFNPTPQYINNFYEIQKAVISNDILYIFIRNSKNILVYDIGNKIKEPYDTNDNYRVQVINKAHRIYLYSFEYQILNMVYNRDNIILILSDGSVYINGKNTNNKISKEKDESTDFINFIDFNISSTKKISYIKIYNNHVYLCDERNIFITGNLKDDEAFNPSNCTVHKNYSTFDNSDEKYFVLSDDEKRILFYESDDELKKYLFNSYTVIVKSNTELSIEFVDTSKETLNFDFKEMDENYKISDIIKLRNDAFILEIIKDVSDSEKSFVYLIFGEDKEHNYRLGIDTESLEPNKFHNISKFIQIDENKKYNDKIIIKSVKSFENKTLILNSAGKILAAGINEGYFFALEDDVVKDFTPITGDVFNKFEDFATTSNLKKPLVLGYNAKFAVGMGASYYLGLKSGSTFRYSDSKISELDNDDSMNNITNSSLYTYFCTGNCIYYTNPVYDLLSHIYTTQTNFEDTSINHIINALLYLKDMSIIYNEDAYVHMVNNLTNLEVAQDSLLSLNKNLYLFSNLQNYAMHDSMLLMYTQDEEKYNCISRFINMIGLMSENFSAMRTKRVKMGAEDLNIFKNSLNDINFESLFSKEERLNGFRHINKNRAR